MSDIMTLRTLICENVAVTHDLGFTPSFLHAYNRNDKTWTVKIGHGFSFKPRMSQGKTLLEGHGTTIEAAYLQLFETTGWKVCIEMYCGPRR